jgi:hypothetical protein
MKRPKVRLVLVIALCLVAGCKTTYNYNDHRQLSNGLKYGKAETNDFPADFHITNEPPDKVVLAVEATNLTPEVEMKVKLTAKEPEETAVPLKLEVKATDKNPVNVSLTVSNTSSLVVPVTLSNDAVKEIIVPVKVWLDTNGSAAAKITSEISLKMDDDLKALLKQMVNRTSDERPELKPTGWFGDLSWLGDFVVLLLIIAISGAAGGCLRTTVDKTLGGKTTKSKSTNLWPNVIFGMTAALLVPVALYLKEGKIFQLGIKDPLLLLILVSASFASGLIGAVFVQWFYLIATKMFESKGRPGGEE